MPVGEVVDSAAAAGEVAARLGGEVVIKPQLGVKGRGKVGGIKFASGRDDAATAASELLGAEVRGEVVSRLLVEARADIAAEHYLAITIDPAARRAVLIACEVGGVEVEAVLRDRPDELLRVPLSMSADELPDDAQRLVRERLGEGADTIAAALWRIFRDHDAEMVEINPVVRTRSGELIAVDAVLNIDDDALFRRPDLATIAAELAREQNPIVTEAHALGFTYVELDGDVAVLSSGAGLTMAILDAMIARGARPANFLDTAQIDDDGIYRAFDLLMRARAEEPPRAVLINIFAGLNRCDRLAEGIARFVRERSPNFPIVVRMVGHREPEGHAILRAAGIEPVRDLDTAIDQVIAATRSAGVPPAPRERGKKDAGETPALPCGTPALPSSWLRDLCAGGVIVQGITGTAARHHTEGMLDFGTPIVAGVRPGAGGTTVCDVPVYDSVADAVRAHDGEGRQDCLPHPIASVLFVPAGAMRAAAFEALDAGVRLLVPVSEHVPLHDALAILERADALGATVFGPNTPGVIDVPARLKLGFIPHEVVAPGSIALASRSGTLTYEIVARLSEAGLGVSTVLGVGGDRVVGTSFATLLDRFESDPRVEAIVLVGEIGGVMEEQAAAKVRTGAISKPVIAYIAGRTAPEGKRMGHAGAIITGSQGTLASKLKAYEAAGIPVAETLSELPGLVAQRVGAGR